MKQMLVVKSEGSALAEFAVALPFLVVLVFGIFDFGGAFTTKQKLSNAAREGARAGSTLPTNDLDSATTPATIDSIRYLVDAYLIAANINDCGLGTAAAAAGPPLTWTYTASGNNCVTPLILTVNRSYPIPTTITGVSNPVNVICTRVTIQYGYQWHFNNVIQLIAPGANYGATAQISVDAATPNID